MIGFHHLIQAYGATDYLACATAAMREASNGMDIIIRIQTLGLRPDRADVIIPASEIYLSVM